MPEIRYICISDLHLGADNSLLTQLGTGPGEVRPDRPSEVLEALARCLKELVGCNEGSEKPTLILNGDALELALAQDSVALMAFERFMELMFPDNSEALIGPNIIFNPGNHDHHLWETARETQYVEFVQGKRATKPGPELPRPWHATNMFNPDLVDSSLLNAVVGRHASMASQNVHVGTVYPNLGVFNADQSRCVIFSHGHYVESIYMLMTTLGNFVFPKRTVPTKIWDIETENFAWIDFFWSALGRSGDVGKDIEQIYDMLLVPDARGRLIRKLARAAGHQLVHSAPKLGEWLGLLSVPLISRLLDRVGGLEKTQAGDNPLTPDAREGLRAYIEGPLALQIMEEHKQPIQVPARFVFGHTHKPFSEAIDYKCFPPGMLVYNTGGWVVDTKETEKNHGAAIVVVDEQMNVASVRMYNEAEDQKDFRVRVEAVDDSLNPLYEKLARLIKCDRDPWRSFSRAVMTNLDQYHANFRARLKMVQ